MSSVTVMGNDASDPAHFNTTFSVTQLLAIPVIFSEVFSISELKILYSLKISDSTSRKSLLNKAKSSRTQFSGICINIGLSYFQRKELPRRRQAQTNSGSVSINSNSLNNRHPLPASSVDPTRAAYVVAEGSISSVRVSQAPEDSNPSVETVTHPTEDLSVLGTS